MNRRHVLGALGTATSLGTLAYATRDPVDTLEIRLWLSERAATYGTARRRVLEYLGRLLDFEFWTVDVSLGGTISVSTEDGALVTSSGEWPLAVTSGTVGPGDIEPASDVNLLVTDGQMRRAPTGYGLPHVASVGGARYLDSLEPFDDLVGTGADGDVERSIVPVRTPTRTMQVLLHEIGHALGLHHDHGVAFRYGDAVVATPMISTYAFDPTYDVDRSRCGTGFATLDDHERRLSLAFSRCARRELRTYTGGIGPRRTIGE
ncbi:peptidase M10A and M12B matrixin and adamalysin [Natrarchaeobius halalkaliphilus]|uniref:Peptidase M10A and M12B matrixin and adamalysin n=1 Tax=Natrarchaeobius halalkaliphilus TaxID=1679091 RepID=A0A3N6LSZ2_9EURY|nr:peptidase M10A and M12B matrixin and adamalysin [Natrarchaeobius halalkaliphilus]RQG91707.1 peptidase M10A and M12B matrixin and adamalysin [Natrarchaeobius halalkaliphilus]